MSISQRISKKTKQKLDEIQAKFVLEKVNSQKLSLPDLIDQMTEFIEDHFDQFKDKVAERFKSAEDEDADLPAFLKMTIETNAAGSPEDYQEYDFNDI
jgi:phage terminase Nu1 subunit (DNA packaging protein)